MAEGLAEIAGFKGDLVWDKSKPDGTPRKVLDVTRLRNLGWKPTISLEVGIRETIQWFRNNRSKVSA